MKPFEGGRNPGITLEGHEEIAVVSSGLQILLGLITPEMLETPTGMSALTDAADLKDSLDMVAYMSERMIADPDFRDGLGGDDDADEAVEVNVHDITHLGLVHIALRAAEESHHNPLVYITAATMLAKFAEINPPLEWPPTASAGS